MASFYCTTDSPIGVITLTSDGTCLTGLYMEKHKGFPVIESDWIEDANAAPLPLARRELKEYFAGTLTEFTIPTKASGTEFQKRVWNELSKIPFGVSISYGELARRIDNPKACRAVGLANGQNPISIIVPCHRVIGSAGKLTGYGGGLPRKEFLLGLEQPSKTKQLSLV
ncbi:MAG TPA: methylated-DNA--[protein]-cysteine S-methyltransferase [Drouetiella sp.]